jgi:hypothetical protein
MEKAVVKIGWEQENPIIPVVLLDKGTRTALAVEVGAKVNVSRDGKTSPAVVHLQFRNLIRSGASVNTALAGALGISQEDTITITKE